MAVIGIESSAHTFGVGIVEKGRVLSNEKEMFKIGTTGMIPGDVAEFHVENSGSVIKRAIEKAEISIKDIEGIGYTRGPGLGPCLQVCRLAAKTLAKRLGVKIVPVNHGVGHIEAARILSGLKDPVVLYVSGGNSQILKLTDKPFTHYRVLGETFDIGVGNMLDSFARSINLNPAWGSTVDKMAEKGSYVELPYNVKGMDFSFAGLMTKASKLAKKHSKEDMCFSIEEIAFSMLCETTERALLLTNSSEVCVCGGVAQSRRLREMLGLMAAEHGAKFGFCANEFNADNGAMIALVAERMLGNGYSVPPERCDIEQRYRVDSALVFR
ncbi:MAG: KEOPS complex N(6)-L-threonylcarbamoyladenine synthase Kae1 [Candidatus Micrarchaeaceae archaeon]